MAPTRDVKALQRELGALPPPGTAQGAPIPGSERPGRSPVYRRINFVDRPLLTTLDPDVRSTHDLFEASARKFPNKQCLGARQWNPATKAWGETFQWETYSQVADRRKYFGAGVVEMHKQNGVDKEKFGVGLWCQNCPEWHIAGTFASRMSLIAGGCRSRYM